MASFIRKKQVLGMIGNPSTATLYRWIKNGVFPRPYSLTASGNGSVAWDLDEVQAWIASRKSARGVSTVGYSAANAA